MTRNERLARAVCAAWGVDPDQAQWNAAPPWHRSSPAPWWENSDIQRIVTDYVAYEAMRAVDLAPHDGLADRRA